MTIQTEPDVVLRGYFSQGETEMTYQLIGPPRIKFSDRYETTMVCDLVREDGETGDVWIVAGVPDYQTGLSDAARTQSGFQIVRVFGDKPDTWCPANFDCKDSAAIVSVCWMAALKAHNSARGE
jgi:hypothetical protein